MPIPDVAAELDAAADAGVGFGDVLVLGSDLEKRPRISEEGGFGVGFAARLVAVRLVTPCGARPASRPSRSTALVNPA